VALFFFSLARKKQVQGTENVPVQGKAEELKRGTAQSNQDTYFTDTEVPWLTNYCCWEQMNPEGREILPQVAFSGFRQRYREPKMSEGFEDIARVEFQVCFVVVFLIVARALTYRLLLPFWGFLFVAVFRTSSVMVFGASTSMIEQVG